MATAPDAECRASADQIHSSQKRPGPIRQSRHILERKPDNIKVFTGLLREGLFVGHTSFLLLPEAGVSVKDQPTPSLLPDNFHLFLKQPLPRSLLQYTKHHTSLLPSRQMQGWRRAEGGAPACPHRYGKLHTSPNPLHFGHHPTQRTGLSQAC